MADWARSGVVELTGRSDGPPLVPPGRGASRARELAGEVAAATAGTPHPVVVDGPALLAERAAFTGHSRAGSLSPGGHCRLLRTADGWAAVSCARDVDPSLLGALVGEDLGPDPWPAVTAWLREHPSDELAERAALLGLAATPVRRPGDRPAFPVHPPRSVEGLLVVDLSALWAGPLCAAVLGLAGARVVKVETPSRPDGARWGNPEFYRLLHAGHRSVVLDPDLPRERRALVSLVAAADIVVEASRPRALAAFGLDAAAAVDEGTSWVSITAAGRASTRVGFGDDVAAGAGLVVRDHDDLLFCGDALADPLTGLTAAALALTAPADGSGVLWDVSMADVVAGTHIGPAGIRPRAARRAAEGWVVDTGAGPVGVSPPRARPVAGATPAMGQHTVEVLRELGIPRP